MKRTAKIERKTKETQIFVKIDLDGTGKSEIDTGYQFINHLLTALSKHSSIDIDINAKGDLAHHIIEGTKALERLVSNVLHFSRPIEIQPEPHDLAHLIREVYKFIKVDPACPENVKIELHLPQEKFEAPIDKQLIRSALLNLISNAFQAIEENEGIITIALMKRMDSYIITISDRAPDPINSVVALDIKGRLGNND